jgi:hypothetical protein
MHKVESVFLDKSYFFTSKHREVVLTLLAQHKLRLIEPEIDDIRRRV